MISVLTSCEAVHGTSVITGETVAGGTSTGSVTVAVNIYSESYTSVCVLMNLLN